jgi:DNA-binding transcriptional MerR regulator
MPEFLLAEQLANKLEVAQAELSGFEARGVIRAVNKNGRVYYSSRDFYRLKGVLHFMRTKGLSIEEAQDQVANWNWLSQAVPTAAN